MDEDNELIDLVTHTTDNHIETSRSSEKVDVLLQAVLDNNEEELIGALPETTEETFKKKHDKYGSKNVVNIACDVPEVSDNVFEILFRHVLENVRNVSLTEEGWYYWEPIHFAAYNIDLGKLRVIIKNMDKNRINALTIFSENALHVLLEYGKRIESFHVQLSNGWESRICHVIAQEEKELVECAMALVNAGIDVNHINMWNESPLIIAIRYRLIKIIEFLLRRRDIDLDTSKDPYTKKSARDLLRENEICVDLLSATTSLDHSSRRTLFTYLKSNDEELFLRYNNENIRQYANVIDGDNEFNTSGTMLQLCLIKGYIAYEKEDVPFHVNDKDIMKSSMLKIFCQKGFVRSLEHLLNNGAEVSKKNRIFCHQNVFQVAVKFSYYPFLAILLEHKSNQIGQYDIVDALKNTTERSFIGENYHLRHVLYLLISKLETFYQSAKLEFIDYDCRRVLNDILDLYLKYNLDNEFDENICQVLRLGASLISKPNDCPRLNQINYETLSTHLDECIDSTNTVCYNSFILDENRNYSETETLHRLCHDTKKTDLLNHPAFIYLIHAKWLKTNKFFYWNMAFYTMFLLSLYVYMVSLQLDNVKPIFLYVFIVFLVIHTFKELVQLSLYRLRYFYDISNYMEASIITCCYANIFLKNEISMVIAILLATLIFLLMLGQLPRFTKYMIIFSSTKYFFEYAMFYFIQFFSFALCFFIMLPPDEEGATTKRVSEIFIKLFDTLIFFIGQYDGPVAHPEEFPIFGRIVVALFIFCMTIILNNLLVGLIVTDMDVIQKTSKLLRQVKMVKYIVRIETFLERMRHLYCCKRLSRLFGQTNIFETRKQKCMVLIPHGNIFDDEDKAWLKKIHENRKPKHNVLKKLYEHIVSDVYYSDHKNLKGNKDIMFKLARLEEQLARLRP